MIFIFQASWCNFVVHMHELCIQWFKGMEQILHRQLIELVSVWVKFLLKMCKHSLDLAKYYCAFTFCPSVWQLFQEWWLREHQSSWTNFILTWSSQLSPPLNWQEGSKRRTRDFLQTQTSDFHLGCHGSNLRYRRATNNWRPIGLITIYLFSDYLNINAYNFIDPFTPQSNVIIYF